MISGSISRDVQTRHGAILAEFEDAWTGVHAASDAQFMIFVERCNSIGRLVHENGLLQEARIIFQAKTPLPRKRSLTCQ